MFFHYIKKEWRIQRMDKMKQFLAEEEELLADFLMDMENAEGNKRYAKAAAIWSMQSARVGAIRDAIEMLSEVGGN